MTRSPLYIIMMLIGLCGAKASPVDSLETLTLNHGSDTLRIIALNDLASLLRSAHPDSAMDLARESLELSRKLDYSPGVARSLKEIGVIYHLQGQYQAAHEALSKSLVLYRQLSHRLGMAKVYNSMGAVFYYQGNYRKALDHYLKSLEIREQLGDQHKVAVSRNNIGNVFYILEDYTQALWYYQNALDLFEQLRDPATVADLYNNIGLVKRKQDEYDLALLYFSRSLSIKDSLQDRSGMAKVNHNIGELYSMEEDDEAALKHLRKALQLKEEVGDKEGLSSTYLVIGGVYARQGESERAFDALRQGMEIAHSLGTTLRVKEGFRAFINAYMKLGDYEKAFHYQSLFMRVKDSVFQAGQERMLEELKSIHEAERRDQELKMLRKDHEISEEKLKNRTLSFYSVIAVLALTGAIAIILLVNLQHKRKANHLLASKNSLIEEKNKELEAINHQKDYMIGIVAHDLKNPLFKITGLVKIIQSGAGKLLPETYQKHLDYILESANQQSRMIHRILDVQALEGASLKARLETVDISGIMLEVKSDFEIQASQKGIELIAPDPGQSAMAIADKDFLRQVLSNLLSNAIKYAPKDTRVYLDARISGRDIRMSIRDEGPGIAPEDQKKLFGKFERLQSKSSSGSSSSGLGLSIVKTYAEAMGGSVGCDSKPGNGATFWVKLPKAL